MDTTPDPPSAAVDELTSALIAIGASLSQIYAHMAEFERLNGPGERPIPEIMHAVLAPVFAHEVETVHGDAVIGTAAAVLRDAEEAIGREIFLVPHTAPARPLPRPVRRARKRARRSGR